MPISQPVVAFAGVCSHDFSSYCFKQNRVYDDEDWIRQLPLCIAKDDTADSQASEGRLLCDCCMKLIFALGELPADSTGTLLLASSCRYLHISVCRCCVVCRYLHAKVATSLVGLSLVRSRTALRRGERRQPRSSPESHSCVSFPRSLGCASIHMAVSSPLASGVERSLLIAIHPSSVYRTLGLLLPPVPRSKYIFASLFSRY